MLITESCMVNTCTALEEFEVQSSLIKKARDNKIFFVDQPFTDIKLIHDISSTLPINGLSSIGVLYTTEWAAYLKYIGYSDITMLTKSHDANLQKICSTFGYKYILIDNARENNMQFDAVVGNPPYQDKTGNEESTNSTDLASVFVKQSFELSKSVVALVIPSDWTGPNRSTLKNFLFNDVKLKRLSLYGSKWFDVKKDTCSIVYDRAHTGDCEVVDINNQSTNFDLSTLKLLSLDNKQTTFIQKFDTTNNLSSRWIRGALHLSDLPQVAGAGVEFICAVGKKNDPLTITNIKKSAESTGFGVNKIVMPNVGEYGRIGNIKIANVNHVGGHSVVFLTTNSITESNNLKAYLESKVIRLLVKSVKKSTPNSKAVFAQIPNIDLSKQWSDTDLYTHFNLTQSEIDYVENNS